MTGHMLTIVMELSELLQLIKFCLIVHVTAVGHHMDVIITTRVQNKLCLRHEHIWALKVVKDL